MKLDDSGQLVVDETSEDDDQTSESDHLDELIQIDKQLSRLDIGLVLKRITAGITWLSFLVITGRSAVITSANIPDESDLLNRDATMAFIAGGIILCPGLWLVLEYFWSQLPTKLAIKYRTIVEKVLDHDPVLVQHHMKTQVCDRHLGIEQSELHLDETASDILTRMLAEKYGEKNEQT